MMKIKINLRKNPLLIAIIVVLSLGLIILSNRFATNRGTNRSTYRIVEETNNNSPINRPSDKDFRILDYTPKWETIRVSGNGNNFFVGVTFSKPVRLDSLIVEVIPQEELEIKLNQNDPRNIWIRPYGGWDYNTNYKLAIREISSSSGETLYNPLILDFTVEEVEVPNVY